MPLLCIHPIPYRFPLNSRLPPHPTGVSDATCALLSRAECATSLVALNLSGCSQVGDGGAAHLGASLSALVELDLSATAVTDDGLAALTPACGQLAHLVLPPAATGAALVHLKRLPLQALDLASVPVSDDQFAVIGDGGDDDDAAFQGRLRALVVPRTVGSNALVTLAALPSLTELDLDFTKAAAQDGDALSALGALDRLTSLSLNQARVDWKGARAVGSLTTLTSLNVARSRLDNRALRFLAPLVNLCSLNLAGTPAPITSAGLIHLTGLVNLRKLRL